MRTGCCAGVWASLRSLCEECEQYTLLHKSRYLSPPPREGWGEGRADIRSERPVGGANRRSLDRNSNKGKKFDAISDTWRTGRCVRTLQYTVHSVHILCACPPVSLPNDPSPNSLSLFLRAPLFPLSQRAGWRARARRHSLHLRSASSLAICFGSDDWYLAIRHRLDRKVKSSSRHTL